MNPDTTPTPRTDSVAVEDTYGDGEIVLASFSRKLERELAEKTNEVARLNQYIRNMQEIIDDDTKQKSELHNEVARLRELCEWAETLLCNSEHQKHCAEWEWNKIVKNWRDQFHGLAPAPEETQDGATMQEWYGGFSKIESTEPVTGLCLICHEKQTTCSSGLCDECKVQEEPVIKESLITEPAPEWRELGQDEVPQIGDEWYSDIGKRWVASIASSGEKVSHFGDIRFRTRRPLPVQEEMPLEDELKDIDEYADKQNDFYTCRVFQSIKYSLHYLRDEIQKLKATVNKTTPNY